MSEIVLNANSPPSEVLTCCINAIEQLSDNEYIYDDQEAVDKCVREWINISIKDARLVAQKLADGENEDTKLIQMLRDVIEDFLPNIGSCVLQDYGRLNIAMIESSKRLGGTS